MADVFISYSREDKARAEQVARGLGALGLDVFWDSEIPPGQTWADYIEDKLSTCKAVVVLWSAYSTRSQWVREEARMGRDKGCLIPAMIDSSQAPFGFGEVQAANLADWSGATDHPEWRRFSEAVRAAASGASAPEVQRRAAAAAAGAPPRQQATGMAPPAASAAPKKGGVPTWVWVVGAVVGTIVVLGVIGTMIPNQQSAPAQNQQALVDQNLASNAGADNNMGSSVPAVTAAPQPQAQPAGDAAPQQVILAQLQQAEQTFRQQGFQQIGQPVSGALQQSQQWNWPVTVVAGWDYRVIGVCDRDCSDLDLSLFDPNGAMVSQDSSTDDHPIVQAQSYFNGVYTIQVTMYQCTVAPCYYALALYGRPGGG